MARYEHQQVPLEKPQSCPAPAAPWLVVQDTTGAGKGPSLSTPKLTRLQLYLPISFTHIDIAQYTAGTQ